MIRVAGWSGIALGIATAWSAFYGAWYLATKGEIWLWMGDRRYPGFGHGPFERLGLTTTPALILGYAVVGLAEATVGAMILAGWTSGLWFSLAILPFELAYWYGFALPLGPLLGLVRVVPTVVLLLQQR